ncbi:MAG: hypothetical protein U0441_26065 [Polyangiaceae bacterium]
MNKTFFSLAVAAVASLVIGCGGNVVGGSGGDGGGTSTAGSGGTTSTMTTTTTDIPPACQVITEQQAPYSVVLQFTASALDAAFYLSEDCYTEFSIYTCDDGFATPLSIHGDCTVDCSESMGCIECGACPQGAIQVTSMAPSESTWDGHTYTFSMTSEGCSCHNQFEAHAGIYRVSVPVYPTEQDAINHTNAIVRNVDFTLPAPNGVVNVPLDVATD